MLRKFNDLEVYTEQFRNTKKVSGLFSICGSFGYVEGDAILKRVDKKNKTIFTYEGEGVRVTAEYTFSKNGVIFRRDSLKNLTGKKIYLRRFFSRFTLEGRDYEVYTQYNGWQHENFGGFQPLVTSVCCQSTGSRLLDGATPFMALKNNQTGKTSVFNLFCNCKWKMTAEIRQIISNYDTVVVETGIDDSGLNMAIMPKETIEMPTIAFYECQNTVDFEAYRLHEILNDAFKKRTLPVIYNSWLGFFDKFNFEKLTAEVDVLADMGVEAFMIDAGWFGEKGVWSQTLGDWEEKSTGNLEGRLKEFSDYVKSKGMKFGLWFEPERVSLTSESLKLHPEFYLDKMLTNFADDKALEFVTERVCKAISDYKVDWVKFDFNITIPYDKSDSGYYRWYQGYDKFIKTVKERFPNIYITLCGAGGYMSELGALRYCDSIWFTDNQAPDNGVRILKDYIKRMPANVIERWDVETYTDKMPLGSNSHIYCGNATWSRTIGMGKEYMHGFLKGGPMGFSCKLSILPNEYREELKTLIAEYKKEREFYQTAVSRVLVDRGNWTVLQYADPKFDKFVVQIFSEEVYQDEMTIYPTVNQKATYKIDEEIIKGEDLVKFGYKVKELTNNSCKQLIFERIK